MRDQIQKKTNRNSPFEVAATPMDEHCDEEDGVEVRDRRGRADAETPGETHDPVGDVVRLAGVCPPAVDEETVAVSGLDVFRVGEGAVRELREGVAEGGDALVLHLEAGLLGHGGIPARQFLQYCVSGVLAKYTHM